MKTKEEITHEDLEREYEAGVDDGYRDGYDEGYADAMEELEETRKDSLDSLVQSATINPLEDFVGRWDAPLRAWVLSQDGREMIVRKEDGR